MKKRIALLLCCSFLAVFHFTASAFTDRDSLRNEPGRDSSLSVRKITDVRKRFEPRSKYNYLDYIQNQNSVAQDGNFWIGGNGVVNGNMLIGTSTYAGYKLDVAGSFRAGTDPQRSITWDGVTFKVVSNGNSAAVLSWDGNWLNVGGANNSDGILIKSLAGTGSLIMQTSNTTSWVRAQQDLSLGSGASNDRLILKGNGNVLIGTSTDGGYKLDVIGTSRFSSNTSIMAIMSSHSNPSGVRLGLNSQSYLGVKRNAGIDYQANGGGRWFAGINEALEADNQDFIFTNYQTGATPVTFKSNGNVLIGTTTNAGYKLDVNGTGRFTGSLNTQGVNYTNNIFSAIPYNATNTGVYVSQYGELLVGFNARKGSSLLHVGDGMVTFDHYAANGTGMAYFDAAGNFYKSKLQVLGQDLYWWDLGPQTANNHKFILNYGGSQGAYALQVKGDIYNGTMSNETIDPDKIVVNSGGVLKYMTRTQLGIGSSGSLSAPANQIVYGTGSGISSSSSLMLNGNILEVGGSDGYGVLQLKNNTAYNSALVGANTGTLYIRGYSKITLENNQVYGAYRHFVTFDEEGRALFGYPTSQGDYKLQVAGNAYMGGLSVYSTSTVPASLGSSNAVYSMLRMQNPSTYVDMGVIDGNYYGVRVNGDTKMSIGTTGVATFYNQIKFGNLSSSPTGSNGGMYYNSSTNQFQGYRNGQWKNFLMEGDASGSSNWSLTGTTIYNSNSGNVGIGTNDTKGYKFAVNGDAIFTKVKVKQYPWADYVFNDDYKLPTLKDVEEYIKKHKHLPDVPSSKEVEENGLDVGENQATLLKKIEELTLYMIDLNKKVEKLTEENEMLKKKIVTANQ